MPFRTTTLPIAMGLAFANLLAGCDGTGTPAASELASSPGDAGLPFHGRVDAGQSCGLSRPVRGALRTSNGATIASVAFTARRDGTLSIAVGTSSAPILELRLVEESATTHTLARGTWPNGSMGDFVDSVPPSSFPAGCGVDAHLRLFGVVRVGASNADVEWKATGATDVGLDYTPCCVGDAGCGYPHRHGAGDGDCDHDVDEDSDEGWDEGLRDGGRCSGGHEDRANDRPRH